MAKRSKTFTINFTPEFFEALKHEAEKEERSIGSFIHLALIKELIKLGHSAEDIT